MKVLRVNLSEQICREEELSSVCLAGRSLIAAILSAETLSIDHPASAANKLIMAPSLLASIGLSDRISLGALSPWQSGQVLGSVSSPWAENLARSGINALVLEGQSDNWLHLEIKEGRASLLPSLLVNLNNYAAQEKLLAHYGAKATYVTIGRAGEMRLPAAGLAFAAAQPGKLRHAGRGGLGAVMGAKNLKSIALFKPQVYVPPSDELLQARQEFIDLLRKHNQSTDNSLRINAEFICLKNCPIACRSAQAHNKSFASEYAGLWQVTLNAQLEKMVKRFHYLCDDLGVDTFSIAHGVALFLKASMLPAGDLQEIITLVEEIGVGSERGRILASGPEIVARVYGLECDFKAVQSKLDKKRELAPELLLADTLGLCVFSIRTIQRQSILRNKLIELMEKYLNFDLKLA